MTFLDLTLYGDPIAKGRPRMGRNGHAYTPERTRAGERAVTAAVAQELAGIAPLAGPCGVSVQFFCATQRKTDADNLLKLVTDAMNGVAFVDDHQIEEFVVMLRRGVGKKDARTHIQVYELPASS